MWFQLRHQYPCYLQYHVSSFVRSRISVSVCGDLHEPQSPCLPVPQTTQTVTLVSSYTSEYLFASQSTQVVAVESESLLSQQATHDVQTHPLDLCLFITDLLTCFPLVLSLRRFMYLSLWPRQIISTVVPFPGLLTPHCPPCFLKNASIVNASYVVVFLDDRPPVLFVHVSYTVKFFIDVYYETINRDWKIKPISEWRCDERLKTKVEESVSLSDIGLFGELEHRTTKDEDEVNRREVFQSVLGVHILKRKWLCYIRIKKRRESGEQCHSWTMIHREDDKTLKRSVHHVSLR
jgi:hypothetical protein